MKRWKRGKGFQTHSQLIMYIFARTLRVHMYFSVPKPQNLKGLRTFCPLQRWKRVSWIKAKTIFLQRSICWDKTNFGLLRPHWNPIMYSQRQILCSRMFIKTMACSIFFIQLVHNAIETLFYCYIMICQHTVSMIFSTVSGRSPLSPGSCGSASTRSSMSPR